MKSFAISSLPLLFLSTAAHAGALLPTEGLVKLNLLYAQQEKGISGVEILSPQMGHWGRLGINSSDARYYLRDAESKNRVLGMNQLAVVWSLEELLADLELADHDQSLDFNSNTRFGRVSYDSLSGIDVQKSSYQFLEIELLFRVHSSTNNTSWIKSFSTGIGSGVRFNFIRKQQTIGMEEVEPNRIYPTLQFSSSFF